MRALRRLAPPIAALVAAVVCSAAPAHAVVIERVVAVIGDKPILQSELHARAKPFLLQVAQRVPPGPQQEVAKSQVYKELLEKIIDDELEAQSAEKAKISVSVEEIDAALKNVASMQNLSVPELVAGARRSGLTEQDYRDEIRRQILEGKMLQLRVKGRIRITEEDLKAHYERMKKGELKVREFHAAWIVIRVPLASSAMAKIERQNLAQELAQRARRGEDFAELARRYSDDTASRDAGGDLGVRAPNGSPQAMQKQRPVVAPEIEGPVMALEPGQVTEPIKAGPEALVIVKLIERQASRYTGYDKDKPMVLQSLQTEILDKAKRKWLDEMKGRVHLDVRL